MHFRRAVEKTFAIVGIDLFPWCYRDRRVLKASILSCLASDPQVHRVLFVGCDYYTAGYHRFFRKKEYWTLDADEKVAKYGARRHVVDRLERLRDHAPPSYFDAIVCNGVFGWGIDTRPAAEQAFEACFDALRDGGIFILGWTDNATRSPFPPESCRSIQCFEPFEFGQFNSARYVTDTPYRHTFLFLRRPSRLSVRS